MTEYVDPVCPACNGVCLPKKGYMGFDNKYIVTWLCQGCGRKVLTHDGLIVDKGVHDNPSKSMPLDNA